MQEEYHIVHQNGSSGPYDIVALVIKIRNGSLNAATMIGKGNTDEVRPAKDWPELQEFFVQPDNSKKEPHQAKALKKLHLSESLKTGITFIQQNPMSTIYSSVIIINMVLLVWIINNELPDIMRPIFYTLAIVFFYLSLSCFQMLTLRMIRGQQTDVSHVFTRISKVERGWPKLMLASLIISLPTIIGVILLVSFDELAIAIVGLTIIIIPGIFAISLFSFTTLLIAEQGYDVRKALETSYTSTFKNSMENFGVYFSLNAINFIAALLLLLPMAITLPVTMSAIAESYDELFS